MSFRDRLKYFSVFILFLIPVYMGASYLNSIWKSSLRAGYGIIDPGVSVLILGDSHSANGIDPAVLGKSANFSDYGESYIQDYFKLKYSLSKKNSIKTVILPVDLHSLNNHRNNAILFIGYWDLVIDFIELGKYKNKLLKYLIYKYIDIDLFDFRGEYMALFNYFSGKIGPQGDVKYINKFRGIKNQYFHRNRDRKGEKRALHHFLGSKWMDEEMLFYFRKIIELCENYGIKLVLVKMPVTVNYYKYARQMVPVNRYYKKVSELIRVHPNVILLDFHNIFFNKEGWKFYDSEHLNADGAKIFSGILKRELIKRGLY